MVRDPVRGSSRSGRRWRIVRHAGPREFLDRAEPWLMRREAENNLVLRKAHSHIAGAPSSGRPLYFATVERSGDVVGCAFRTPPWKLALTRMPLEPIPALARNVAEVYGEMPAAMGPNRVVCAFGEEYGALTGARAAVGVRQRIYRLETVSTLSRTAPGAMRLAGPADVRLVTRWTAAFNREAAQRVVSDLEAVMRRRVGGEGGGSTLALWVRDEPVSMAGFSSRTRHGVNIGPVYTPVGHRRNGYATSLVAEVSRDALSSGARHCTLYTDLANPTSNRIYREIGYRPLLDVMDIEFTAPNDHSR